MTDNKAHPFDFDGQPQLMGHPVGLYILFFTELWERFSYYGMRAILVLYITAQAVDNPGLGWEEADALALYGWYTMMVYVMSIPGGILADKFVGQKQAVIIGGLLLCAGHLTLAVDAIWAFYTGLILIVLGVGALKPNISTMVGGLYSQKDDRRDKAFYIFYIGINVGAFLSPLIVGYIGEKIGWHYGFGLAGIGMLLGQSVFMWGRRYLKGVGELNAGETQAFVNTDEPQKTPNLIKKFFGDTTAMAVAGLLTAVSILSFDDIGYKVLFAVLSIALGIGMVIYKELNRVERDRVLVLLLSFLIVIVFWGAFEQAGGLMNLYAKQKTDRMLLGWQVPASWFQSLNPFFIITLALPIGSFWYWWKHRGRESSSLFKMALGVIIMGLGFLFMSMASLEYENAGKSAMYWLVLAYLFHTVGELCASPVALSFITKLAPVKYASLMMGIYFAATGLGNKVAGVLGEWSQSAGELEIFTGIAAFCAVFGLLVLAILKPLKRLTHGAEDLSEEVEPVEAESETI
jgi:POT family proton-dependent oligopeptide transporter